MLLGFLFGNAHIAHMVHLGGAIFGFIYLKADWKVISLSQKVKNLRHKRQETKLQKNREKAEEVMKRVDAILDKINEVGIENLTKAERKLLEDASDHLSEKEK
jgi:phage shock protein A